MWIDVAFAVFASIGFYWGYSRGIIKTLISVVAMFVAFVLAIRFGPAITHALADVFQQPATGFFPLLGFVVAFVLVLVALRLIANVLERGLQAIRLNFVNQIAGGVVTAVVAVVALSFLLWFGDSAALIQPSSKSDSITYPALEALPDQAYTLIGKAKPALDDLREAGEEALK